MDLESLRYWIFPCKPIPIHHLLYGLYFHCVDHHHGFASTQAYFSKQEKVALNYLYPTKYTLSKEQGYKASYRIRYKIKYICTTIAKEGSLHDLKSATVKNAQKE